MLLARLKRENEYAVALRVARLSRDSAGQVSYELLRGAHEAAVRAAEAERQAEGLRIADGYIGAIVAGTLYERFCRPRYGFSATVLPSTSPANASFSLEKLVEAWRVIASPLNTK